MGMLMQSFSVLLTWYQSSGPVKMRCIDVSVSMIPGTSCCWHYEWVSTFCENVHCKLDVDWLLSWESCNGECWLFVEWVHPAYTHWLVSALHSETCISSYLFRMLHQRTKTHTGLAHVIRVDHFYNDRTTMDTESPMTDIGLFQRCNVTVTSMFQCTGPP